MNTRKTWPRIVGLLSLILALFAFVSARADDVNQWQKSGKAIAGTSADPILPMIADVATAATPTSNAPSITVDGAVPSNAQIVTNAPGTVSTTTVFNPWLAWIAVVVPLVIAGVKYVIPKIPSHWLPILAPMFGALADLIASYTTGKTINPALGALLGLAGVGIREFIDQLKQRATDGSTPAGKVTTAILFFALLPTLMFVGCKSGTQTLDTNGVYANGTVLKTPAVVTNAADGSTTTNATQLMWGLMIFQFDQGVETTLGSIDSFLAWELANRQALSQWPEIKSTADTIRANVPKYSKVVWTLRANFVNNPTAATQSNLLSAVAQLNNVNTMALSLQSSHVSIVTNIVAPPIKAPPTNAPATNSVILTPPNPVPVPLSAAPSTSPANAPTPAPSTNAPTPVVTPGAHN